MALDMKAFNAIIGKPKVPKTHRDNDGDGLMNMLDCKPNDPKKQGVIHRIGAAVVEKFGATERAEELRERGKILDTARKEARIESTKARAEQIKETSMFREKERGRLSRERIKSGGVLGSLTRGISKAGKFVSPVQTKPVRTIPTRTRKTKKGKGKKGKRKARVISKIQKEQQPRKSFDFRDVGRAF